MAIHTNLNGGITSITPEATRAELEYLVNVGKEISEAEKQPIVKTIGGHDYVFFGGKYERIRTIEPDEEKQPECLKVFSLNGLVDYIKTDVDGMFGNPERRHIVRVSNPGMVQVYTPVTGYHKKRYLVAQCEALVPPIPFDRYMDAEDFQIMVQTRFEQGDNRALVLQLSGSLRKEQSMQKADDGVSQKVTINKGVASAADVTVRNPVELIPLRTFHEVDQPASPFVLRFDEGAEVALFEGDGGAWKLKAVENIKKWLVAQLKDCNVEIIA